LPGAGLVASVMPVGFSFTSVVDIPCGGVGYVVPSGGGVGYVVTYGQSSGLMQLPSSSRTYWSLHSQIGLL